MDRRKREVRELARRTRWSYTRAMRYLDRQRAEAAERDETAQAEPAEE